MAGKSDYLADKLLNWLRGTAFPTVPSNFYLSLHTADPTDAGSTAAEVSGGSYARVAVTPASWLGAPSNSGGTATSTNNSAITFADPTANWGTVTHFALWDASTAGNMLYSAALTTSRTINSGDATPQFAAGQLSVAES